MKQQRILWLLVVTFVVPQAGFSQGMVEQGGIYSGVAGLGAGLAAGGRAHADTLKHSFEAVGRAQQAVQQSVQEQTAIIEHNMKLGCQFEAAKQWESAENAFKWVLQGIAHRDGPGSPAAVPALKHLVNISEAQEKLDDAIGFQKTVVAFGKVGKGFEPASLAQDQIRLCELYCKKNDYGTAEPILRKMVQDPDASLSDEQRCAALTNYYQVLQRLNKRPYIDPRSIATEKTNPVDQPAVTTTEQTKPAEEPKLTTTEQTKPAEESKLTTTDQTKAADQTMATTTAQTKAVEEPELTTPEQIRTARAKLTKTERAKLDKEAELAAKERNKLAKEAKLAEIEKKKLAAIERTKLAREAKLASTERNKLAKETKQGTAEQTEAAPTEQTAEPKLAATDQTNPVDQTAHAMEMAKSEATQLLDYVMNTILRQRTALLNLPLSAVLQGRDISPDKSAADHPGEVKPAATEP